MTDHMDPFGWAELDRRNEVIQAHAHLQQCCWFPCLWVLEPLGIHLGGWIPSVSGFPDCRLHLQSVFPLCAEVGHGGISDICDNFGGHAEVRRTVNETYWKKQVKYHKLCVLGVLVWNQEGIWMDLFQTHPEAHVNDGEVYFTNIDRP